MSNLTTRTVIEALGHEAIVLEAYLDSENIWTWAGGITNASGHQVYPRYLDNPQTVSKCVEETVGLIRRKYMPEVLSAFQGYTLAEHELAAAISFHWNTGAIGRASWVKDVKAGRTAAAKTNFMLWRKPASIIERRKKECDLFFRGVWSQDGKTLVIPVNRAIHKPNFRRAQRVDVSGIVRQLLGGA